MIKDLRVTTVSSSVSLSKPDDCLLVVSALRRDAGFYLPRTAGHHAGALTTY
jgi:hypothetical protein